METETTGSSSRRLGAAILGLLHGHVELFGIELQEQKARTLSLLLFAGLALVFALLLLDNQHRVIQFVELFYGTLDSASVWPREIVQIALKHNAAAVILAHNHPSGVAEPSRADRQITDRILAALALIDIRVLDHLVIGDGITVSFAERGWL